MAETRGISLERPAVRLSPGGFEWMAIELSPGDQLTAGRYENVRFAADIEHHCGSLSAPALRVQVKYDES